MPAHPPLYVNTVAGSLGHNRCYEFMVESYLRHGIDTWPTQELYENFGDIQVDILKEEKFVEEIQRENIQLAFTVTSTEPFRMLANLAEGIRHFEELEAALSQVRKCSGARLRDLISHLRNFGLVEVINLPASTTCAIALNTPEFERQLDALAQSAEYMDFPYIESQEDEIKEHKRLMELEAKMRDRIKGYSPIQEDPEQLE